MPQGNRDSKPRAWTTDAILALVEPHTRSLIRRAIAGSGIGGGGGDHGILVGLSDDDHIQYLLDATATGGLGITVSGRVISADLGDIDHDLLLNFLANEHIDWTAATAAFSTSGTAATGNLTVTGGITVSGLVDGRDVAVDGAKLDAVDDDAMLSPIGLSIANLTDVTASISDTTNFLYLGRTMRAITTALFLARVTTAFVPGVGSSWAEIGVFTGEVEASTGIISLSRVGFTDVSTLFNSIGIKTITITLSGVSIGDGLWLAWGTKEGSLGTRFELRAMLADNIVSGVFRRRGGQLSLLSIPVSSLPAFSTEKPAWARLKI